MMVGRGREVWVQPASKDVLLAAVESGISTIVVDDDQKADEWSSLAIFSSARLDKDGCTLHTPDGKTAPVVVVDTPNAQQTAMDLAGREDMVVMEAADWRVIPAENIIASYRPTRTRIFVVVKTTADAKVMLTTLEVGVDGIILHSDDPREAVKLGSLVTNSSDAQELCDFRVESVSPIGVGDRVCVDTCSLLRVDEGLLVGSFSQRTLLVLSEAAEAAYVPSRPFRVNAGSVASYCIAPEGRTRYLSELRAGDSVLAFGADGKVREVSIARCKVEVRPMLLLSYSDPQDTEKPTRTYSAVLQNAETVRIATPGSKQGKPITSLKAGDIVQGRRDTAGRHVGMKVDETILEV